MLLNALSHVKFHLIVVSFSNIIYILGVNAILIVHS